MRSLSGFFFILLSLNAYALSTEHVNILPGSRVAIMTGTYSPPHRRHHEIFLQLLESGLVDYVLVIPNDVTPHKPFALHPSTRLQMLEAGYSKDPRILYPHDLDIGFPLSSKTKEYLDSKFQDIQWIGVMGKDSSKNHWAKLGARLQKVAAWIVLSPDSGDENEIPKSFGKTKVTRLYAPTENDVHSKEIRVAAAAGDMDELEKLLLPKVAQFVVGEELYKKPDPKAKFLDYVKNCKRLLFKYANL